MSSSNCCFLTCIQVTREAGQVIWYSHLFQNLTVAFYWRINMERFWPVGQRRKELARRDQFSHNNHISQQKRCGTRTGTIDTHCPLPASSPGHVVLIHLWMVSPLCSQEWPCGPGWPMNMCIPLVKVNGSKMGMWCAQGCDEWNRKHVTYLRIFKFLCAVLCLVAQSCLTLCDPMSCSPPDSSVHGILQTRILEWVAMPSSRGSSQPRDRTQVSCIAGGLPTVWATREAQTTKKGGKGRQKQTIK